MRLARSAVAQCKLHPSQRQCVKRVRPFLEPDVFRLTEPVNQQRHGGGKMATFQQRLDNPGIGLRRIELLDIGAPEVQVAAAGARLLRRRQRLGDSLRGRISFAPRDPAESRNRVTGKSVPPLGQLAELLGKPSEHLRFLARRGLMPQPRLAPKIDSMISSSSSTRGSGMLFSTAGNKLNCPPKPRMFQGSMIAPQPMPRSSRSSICVAASQSLDQSAALGGAMGGRSPGIGSGTRSAPTRPARPAPAATPPREIRVAAKS